MSITEKDVQYVAALANLEIADQETTQLAADMNSILGYIAKLDELDTSNVEPMEQVLLNPGEDRGVSLRPDRDRPGYQQQESVANAPESGAGHFKVPKVIER